MKLTIFQVKLAFNQQNKNKIMENHTLLLFRHISAFVSVFHRIILVNVTHSSQFMEYQNLGVTTFKHATSAPNSF